MPICGAVIDQCEVTQQASLSPRKPMTASLKWRNYAFPRGTRIVAGFLIGVYDEPTTSFKAWVFELEGKSYIWGAGWTEYMDREPEATIQHTEQLYSFDLPGAHICSAMAFLAQGGNINVLVGDWGVGERICAVSWDDFMRLSLVDKCIYKDILSISEN